MACSGPQPNPPVKPKSPPVPALASATAALAALPFSAAAAATLLLTAGLGLIIHADYVLRRRPAPLPGYRWRRSTAHFRRCAAVATERNRLAA